MQADPSSLGGWLEHISRVHVKDIDMGLDRIRLVARRLDVLKPARKVVTVAGTNGKGSTCMALERLLMEDGRSVGTTLSPHVERFNERVRVNGSELPDAALCDLFAEVEAARGDVPLTYFEFSALVALLGFRRAGVHTAILEIGLGGRLDAFNAVDADLAIVTSIGLDHQDYLGSDLETIGREKAGIFRAGQAVVLGSVTDSVHEAAADLDCSVLALDRDFAVTESRGCWSYRCDALGLDFGRLDRGGLAPVNCALAITAAACLEAVPAAHVLAEVRLAGRLEQRQLDGLPVVLDVAHNPAGAGFLAAQLRHLFPDRRFTAIYGALADKDCVGVTAALDGLVKRWLAVPTAGWRSQSAEALAAKLPLPVTVCPSLAAALDEAGSSLPTGDGILVFGSFSAVEQARKLLRSRGSATDCGEKRVGTSD